jgi:hypothetical protein
LASFASTIAGMRPTNIKISQRFIHHLRAAWSAAEF